MPTFNLEFYLASDIGMNKNSEHFKCTLETIDTFGELYSENLLLKLDTHYELYQSKIDPSWSLNKLGNLNNISGITTLTKKTRLPGVSGNIGEALIIPALSGVLKNKNLQYHRIFATKKCPDFRIECSDSLINLWCSTYSKKYPPVIPLEVKTMYGKDKNYPFNALNQLISYWEMASTDRLSSYVGFGIIARVNLGPNEGTIRFVLFRPKSNFSLDKLKTFMSQNNKNKQRHKKVEDFFE